MRPHGRVVRMLGPEVPQLRPVELAGEACAQQLVAKIVAQVPGHDLEPDQAVGGPPGLGLVAEQDELGRQQLGVGLQIGVHAGGVGLVDRLHLGREHLEITLGGAVEPQRAQEFVGLDAGLAHHGREPRLPDPALQLQLPEPVLRVDVAHGEGAVLGRLGEDVGDRMGVADHLHRRIEAGNLLIAVVGGEREPGARARRQQHAEQHQRAGRRAVGSKSPECDALPPTCPVEGGGTHHESPSAITGPCSSSSGAGGRSLGSGYADILIGLPAIFTSPATGS